MDDVFPDGRAMGMMLGKIDVECAKFEVVKKIGSMQIRRYAPCVAVETECDMANSNDPAFRRLAKYIGVFGKPENNGGQAIAMTAPVVNTSVPIAMTAPVTNSNGKMAFILPSKYQSVAEAPPPTDEKVTLRQIEARTMAVLTFSGMARPPAVESHVSELRQLLKENGLAAPSEGAADFELARYNPPWTLSPLRTNEVLIPVDEGRLQ